MGKRELVALLNLSSWCLVTVGRFLLAVPGGCLRFVIVVFPDHTHLLFLVIPASNLGYLAAPNPRTIFHGCQIVHWYPQMRNEGVLKNGMCYVKMHGFHGNP